MEPTPNAQPDPSALGIPAVAADTYHALFQAMDQGFCLLEMEFDAAGERVVDFRYLEVNAAFLGQSGLPADAPGKTARALLPDLDPFWFDTYGRVARTGEAVRLERHVPQVGRWFDVHAFRVGPPEAGQLAVLFSDISARRQAEEQLRRAAEAETLRLRLANALGPLIDPVAVQEAVTRLARQHFGADHCHYGEIEGGHIIIRHAAAAEGRRSVAGTYPLAGLVLTQAVIAAGQPFSVRDVHQDESVDESLRQLCGQLEVASYLNVPVIKNGQLAGIFCLVQSVPRAWTAAETALAAEVAERAWAAVEHARAEAALRASESKYRTLFDSIDEGFVISELLYDEQGRPVDALVLESNPSYDRITQTTGTAGRRAKEMFPEAESAWFEAYAQVVTTGVGLRFEDYFAPLDRWIEMFVARVGGAGSSRFASIFNDITERKRHENHAVFLDELSQALAVLDGPDEIVRATGERLGACLGVGFLNVCGVELAAGAEPAEACVTVACAWEGAGRPSKRGSYRAGDCLSPEFLRAARAGEAIVIRNTDTDPRVDAAAYRAIGMRAFVAVPVPVLNDGAWPALISAFTPNPRDWRPDEVELLVEVARRVFLRIERARAEEARRTSEWQLRAVYDSTQDFIGLLSPDGVMLRTNRASLTFANSTEDEVIGKPFWEAVWFSNTPGMPEQVRQRVAAAAQGERSQVEATLVRPTGERRTYDFSLYPIKNEHGEVVLIVPEGHDITDRKQAEEALRAIQQRQHVLLANLPGAALFIVDRDLRYQLAEGDALRQAGHVPADFLGRTVREMVEPAHQSAFEELLRQALAGHPFEHEHEQGGRIFLTRGVPLTGPAGEVNAVLAVSYDLTDRKQAEEALRESEERFRAVANLGPALLWRSTPGSDATWYNQRWHEYTGQTLAEAAGYGWENVIHADDQAESSRRYRAALANGQPLHQEHRIRSAQGEYRWFQVQVRPVHGPQGEVSAWFGAATDIHARKQAEEALRLTEESHRAELEQQVADRTRDLRKSRHLLQTVFDASPTAIAVMRVLYDAAGRAEDFEFLITNEFNKQVVGRDDLVGQRFSAMFPQTVPTGTLARLLQVATTGEPADFEQWYVGEGMQHWFRHIVVRQDGLLVLTSEVVTARKQAEQERTRTLRLLEQAETVAGLGSWDYDVTSGQFAWSDGMYRLFGLPQGQPVTPEIYLDYVVDEDRLRAGQFVRQLRAGLQNVEETLRLRVGGAVKTVRLKFVVLRDAQGQPTRTLGVDLDISELNRLDQDNLRLRLTQQRALFEAVQAAQEAERRRMAESLHNGIGQILFATKLRLDLLHTPALYTEPALLAARHEADQLLGEAIRQTRALSHELVPMVLEEFGLAAAMQDIGHKISTPQLHLRCQVVLDEAAAALAPALQMAIYRMAQELALNIGKHARGATAASLELETMPGWVLLRAEDNGAGFAPHPPQGVGLGLHSIRDRVALLGGQLETGATPTGGAYVRIRIPIPIIPAP